MLKKAQQICKKIAVKITDIAVFMVVLPSTSFATSIGSVLEKTNEYLQGSIARSVAVFALIIAGYLCIIKQMFPKMYLMMILLGLGLIFGASELYSILVG